MGRSIFGAMVGVVIGVVIVALVETLGMRLFPLPVGIDPTDPDALAAALPTLPVGSFLFILAAWFLGAWTGATTAMRFSRGTARWPGFVVGGTILTASLYMLWTIPHPRWFSITAVAGLVAITLVASRPGGTFARTKE